LRFTTRALLLVLLAAGAARAETSRLWGTAGEWWSPESRLPDFSWAGYRGGEKPLPESTVKVSVKDFGAVGDGVADDSDAFLRAIDAVEDGAILIPAGRYKITRQLKVSKRGVAFKGAGEDKTVLFFPRSLTEAVGPGKGHAPANSWSWSGGFISFEGEDEGERLAAVTSGARRGGRRLVVSSTESMMPGQWVRVVLTDADGSLARHLHDEKADGAREYRKKKLVDFASPIESIDGNAIVLKRPLRTDVRLEWKPQILAFSPSVQEVGVENLTIEFPEKPYAGHHDEPGYNAISFEGVANGWVRHVRIVDADSGIFLRDHSSFCTLEFLSFVAGPGRIRKGYGRDRGEPQSLEVAGHHGVLMEDFANDNLVTNFSFDVRYIHDTGVSAWSSGNVFSKGKGIDLVFDHHRRAPYENLFTEIKVGEGSRVWQGGGDESDGPMSGARETFWNVSADRPLSAAPWAIEGNFVGLTTSEPSALPQDGNWLEAIPPSALSPADLHLAQKARRKSP
jgi:hypothetical protein